AAGAVAGAGAGTPPGVRAGACPGAAAGVWLGAAAGVWLGSPTGAVAADWPAAGGGGWPGGVDRDPLMRPSVAAASLIACARSVVTDSDTRYLSWPEVAIT